ncbi:MAG: histidine ammonia-lyase, partial [Paracoccaceae bacterium]
MNNPADTSLPILRLNGTSLQLEDFLPLLRPLPGSRSLGVEIEPSVYPGIEASRAMVQAHVDAGDVVYGLTTGFGKLKNVAVPREDLVELQHNLIVSHCVGVGDAMPVREVRIAQVLRLNSLLRGVSGVRRVLVDHLANVFNQGFVPVVPQQGSVGASGDLAPLSHMAAAMMGFGRAQIVSADGSVSAPMEARAALDKAGLAPLVLQAKEGLALINGTEIMKASAICSVLRATNLSKSADAIASLAIEALKGSIRPFQDLLAQLKNNEGQRRTAANVRACLAHSEVLASHVDCDRVQDPYSLRCVPQIHGAFKTSLAHVTDVLGGELNAVTDNPLVVPETGEVFSAGLFHGQPLSMILDYLGLSMCTLANVSERRVEQLVNPDLSGLPAFLSPKPGLHSGLMIAQYAAAAIASENKVYAHPASVDTIPTSANQEDHVSMGVTAARKARMILDNVEAGLGIELVCGAQAREFTKDLRAGRGAEAAYSAIRETVEPLEGDRYLQPDLEAARDCIASGHLVASVEAAVG